MEEEAAASSNQTAGEDCLVGRRVSAIYHDQSVSHFRGHPLTEVFEEERSLQSIARALRSRPSIDPALRQKGPMIRMSALRADAKLFFEPMKTHLELVERMDLVMRLGLVGRNPLVKHAACQSEPENTLNLFGASGMGKSRTTKEILTKLYPQVIDHSNFHGRRFHFAQVVWIYLNAPALGTPRALCLEFTRAVDRALYRDANGHALGNLEVEGYEVRYNRSGRSSIDSLTASMATIIRNHGVALLVLDELAHLKTLKTGEAQRHFNFLFSMLDRLGVPVFLIGTYDGIPILQQQARIMGRVSGHGDWIWDRFVENDKPWNHMLNALFTYQYVKNPIPYDDPLRPAVSEALYYETQGVLRYLKELWFFAQEEAMKSKVERLTPQVIHGAARKRMIATQGLRTALREGAGRS